MSDDQVADRAAIAGNKRVNDAIQTALELGELRITDEGWLAALRQPPASAWQGIEPTALMHTHPDYGAEFEPYRNGLAGLTDADRKAGWAETPLFAPLATIPLADMDHSGFADSGA